MIYLKEYKNYNNCDYFGDKTGISFYDTAFDLPLYYFLEKHVKVKIEYMSPDDFLRKISSKTFSYEAQIEYLKSSQKNVDSLKKKMQDDIKIDMPHILYTERSIEHEGRHRSMAAKQLGCEKMPVSIFKMITMEDKKKFLSKHANDSFDDLNEYFKNLGFKGISDLGYRTFERQVEFLLESDQLDIIINKEKYNIKNKDLTKWYLDKISDYKTKKHIIEELFDTDNEELNIDKVNNLIEENPFLKEYTMLMYKEREKDFIEDSIELKRGMDDDMEEEIESLQKELESYADLDDKFSELDNYILDKEKELKRGISPSTLFI